MPDSIETRFARLEQRVTDIEIRVDRRLDEMQSYLRQVDGLVVGHAKVLLLIEQIKEGLAEARVEARGAHKAIAELEDHLEARDEKRREDREKRREEERRDQRQSRRTLQGGMILVVLTAVGSLVVQLLVAAPGP